MPYGPYSPVSPLSPFKLANCSGVKSLYVNGSPLGPASPFSPWSPCGPTSPFSPFKAKSYSSVKSSYTKAAPWIPSFPSLNTGTVFLSIIFPSKTNAKYTC